MDLFSLKPHPAADLFPRLQGAELDKLIEDIQKNGLRNPIVLIEDKGSLLVLDGRNRLRACKWAKVEPTYTIWSGDDPLAYVVSANLHRRHLEESQLAMLAISIEQFHAAQANARKGGRPKKEAEKLTPGLGEVSTSSRHGRESSAKAAAQVGVSRVLVQGAKKVKKKAPPTVTKAIEEGKVTVSDALRVLEYPADKQLEAVAKVEAGEAKTLREALSVAPSTTGSKRSSPTKAPAPPTKSARGKRSPKQELPRVLELHGFVLHALEAWRELVREWDKHHHDDMQAALAESKAVLSALDAASARSIEVVIRCNAGEAA